MPKNVLILSASPRRGGNSDLLCDAVAEGARSVGHAVRKIRLADLRVRPCTGCLNTLHGRPCPLAADDVRDVARQMLAADVIVLATPVYFYSMCGQLKTFLDRQCPYYRETRGKTFGFVMTAADDDPACVDSTLEAMRGYLRCLDAPREAFVLRAVGLTETGEARGSAFWDEAVAAGKAL